MSTTADTPDSFSDTWYRQTIAPLDIDLAAHFIPNPDTLPTGPDTPPDPTSPPRTDWHFVNHDLGYMGLIDYTPAPTDRPTALSATAYDPNNTPEQMIRYLESRVSHNVALYGADTRCDLRRILSSALERYGSPPGFSALLMDCSSNILRVAWIGTCGFLLIRDEAVHVRSYPHTQPRDALDSVLSHSTKTPPEDRYNHPHYYWSSWGDRTDTGMPGSYSTAQFSVDCDQVASEYIELQDNDLVIAGTDGFFSNVSEKQILAFVRPVSDAEDPTLAIANNTCLGSWRWDDVVFITYYLAIIAINFATAANSRPHLPFPFPPSPHVDDVTVLSAACCFQG